MRIRLLTTLLHQMLYPTGIHKWIRQVFWYMKCWEEYSDLQHSPLLVKDMLPCLYDKNTTSIPDYHYIYQAIWAFRCLAKSNPPFHVDIGSSLYAVALFSLLTDVTFVDLRQVNISLSNLTNVIGNITHLPFRTGSIPSVSCLHVIEHIGLGRYGDTLDTYGTEKAVTELQRIVSPQGKLYLSTPVGRSRIRFNAHRIFNPSYIVDLFKGFNLESFALVDDKGIFHQQSRLEGAETAKYSCGLYTFNRS